MELYTQLISTVPTFTPLDLLGPLNVPLTSTSSIPMVIPKTATVVPSFILDSSSPNAREENVSRFESDRLALNYGKHHRPSVFANIGYEFKRGQIIKDAFCKGF